MRFGLRHESLLVHAPNEFPTSGLSLLTSRVWRTRSVMITGIASDGVYDLLFQYLKLKLGFTTKDLVRCLPRCLSPYLLWWRTSAQCWRDPKP